MHNTNSSPKKELKTIPFARVSKTVFHQPNRHPTLSTLQADVEEEIKYPDTGKTALNQRYKTMQEAVCQLAAELDTSSTFRTRTTRQDRNAAKRAIGSSEPEPDCTPLSKRARGTNLGNDFTPLRNTNYRNMLTVRNSEGFHSEPEPKFASPPSLYAHTAVKENWYPQSPSAGARSPSASPIRTQKNQQQHESMQRRPVHASFPTHFDGLFNIGNNGKSNRPDDTPSRFYPSPNSPLKVNTMQVPRPPLPQLYLKGRGMDDPSEDRQDAATISGAENNIFTRQLKTASEVLCKGTSITSVAPFIQDTETVRPCTADNSNVGSSYHGGVGAPKLASFPVTPQREAPNILN